MPANDKRALRKALRERFDAEQRSAESSLICQHVLRWDAYHRAEVIGGYMPMKHEADILPVLHVALREGKTLALPLCAQMPQMTFHRVASLEDLVPGAYGLMEPSAAAPVIAPEEIDLLLTPLEGIDHQGMRLGKGGGYYDCFLAGKNVLTLGVALSWQWVDKLEADAWDQPLKAAVDRRGIHVFEMNRIEK